MPKKVMSVKAAEIIITEKQQSFDALVAIECRESHAELTRMIKQVLSDADRSGSPGKFTPKHSSSITSIEPLHGPFAGPTLAARSKLSPIPGHVLGAKTGQPTVKIRNISP